MATENYGYDPAAEGQKIHDTVVNSFTQSKSYLSLSINGVELNLHIDDSTADLDTKLIEVFDKIAEMITQAQK